MASKKRPHSPSGDALHQEPHLKVSRQSSHNDQTREAIPPPQTPSLFSTPGIGGPQPSSGPVSHRSVFAPVNFCPSNTPSTAALQPESCASIVSATDVVGSGTPPRTVSRTDPDASVPDLASHGIKCFGSRPISDAVKSDNSSSISTNSSRSAQVDSLDAPAYGLNYQAQPLNSEYQRPGFASYSSQYEQFAGARAGFVPSGIGAPQRHAPNTIPYMANSSQFTAPQQGFAKYCAFTGQRLNYPGAPNGPEYSPFARFASGESLGMPVWNQNVKHRVRFSRRPAAINSSSLSSQAPNSSVTPTNSAFQAVGAVIMPPAVQLYPNFSSLHSPSATVSPTSIPPSTVIHTPPVRRSAKAKTVGPVVSQQPPQPSAGAAINTTEKGIEHKLKTRRGRAIGAVPSLNSIYSRLVQDAAKAKGSKLTKKEKSDIRAVAEMGYYGAPEDDDTQEQPQTMNQQHQNLQLVHKTPSATAMAQSKTAEAGVALPMSTQVAGQPCKVQTQSSTASSQRPISFQGKLLDPLTIENAIQQCSQYQGSSLAVKAPPQPFVGTDTFCDRDYHITMLNLKRTEHIIDDIKNSPVFVVPVAERLRQHGSVEDFTQFGLLAGVLDSSSDNSQSDDDESDVAVMDYDMSESHTMSVDDPRLFFNITSPSSTFICGSQGSGKSHTLSCMLENCLIPSKLGRLTTPLAGLVFHYDAFTSDSGGSPCEAAFLASQLRQRVRILCSPSNIATIKRIYKDLNVTVEPLRIGQNHLTTSRMMDLMGASNLERTPLYLHTIMTVLRDMRVMQQTMLAQGGEQAAQATGFNYFEFKARVSEKRFSEFQRGPLKLRLDLLESFMPPHQFATLDQVNLQQIPLHERRGTDWTTTSGSLTIVDLSCPFIGADTACMLFNMCLSLFLEQTKTVGRVVALDEAHKFMTNTPSAEIFTGNLLSAIRLQRHEGVRVIIATQEPTISPKLLELCSMTIVHRFSSPQWLAALEKHLAAASMMAINSNSERRSDGCNELRALFDKVVALKRGDALLFAPSAIFMFKDSRGHKELEKLGSRYVRIRVRERLTADGGRSILAL